MNSKKIFTPEEALKILNDVYQMIVYKDKYHMKESKKPLNSDTIKSFYEAFYGGFSILLRSLNLSDEILADMFLSMVNLKKLVEHATSNPTLNKKYMPNIKHINKKLHEINLAAVEISKELDKIR